MSKEKMKYLKNEIQVSDSTIQWLDSLDKQIHRKMVVWLGTEYDKARLVKKPPTDAEFSLENIKYVQDWFLQNSPNLSEFTYQQAYDASVSWHAELAKAAETSTKRYDTNNVVFEMDGLQIVQMATKKDLKAEGERMGHCVGGYDVDDKHKFYSLRDRKNEPHATMEVTVNDKGTHSVVQIKGKQNKVPIQEYQYIIVNFLFEMVTKHGWDILDCNDYNNFGEDRLIEIVSDTACELRKTFTYKGEKKVVHMMTISQNVIVPVPIFESKGLKVIKLDSQKEAASDFEKLGYTSVNSYVKINTKYYSVYDNDGILLAILEVSVNKKIRSLVTLHVSKTATLEDVHKKFILKFLDKMVASEKWDIKTYFNSDANVLI